MHGWRCWSRTQVTQSEASPGRVNDVCLSPSRVGMYACAGVGVGVGVGADAGSGGDPEDDGGGSSALDGATDMKAWESRFWKCLLSRYATSQFTFSLLCLRLLTGLVLFVRAGRNGTSSTWSQATELQAAPRRVCCGAWGGTGICSKCCHVWCSWWADEPHMRRRCWWAQWARLG